MELMCFYVLYGLVPNDAGRDVHVPYQTSSKQEIQGELLRLLQFEENEESLELPRLLLCSVLPLPKCLLGASLHGCRGRRSYQIGYNTPAGKQC